MPLGTPVADTAMGAVDVTVVGFAAEAHADSNRVAINGFAMLFAVHLMDKVTCHAIVSSSARKSGTVEVSQSAQVNNS
jgi:hypothetical protein